MIELVPITQQRVQLVLLPRGSRILAVTPDGEKLVVDSTRGALGITRKLVWVFEGEEAPEGKIIQVIFGHGTVKCLVESF